MSRPEVRLDDAEAIRAYTEHYKNRGPNPVFARLGLFAMSKLYVPHITYTEQTPRIITEELDAGAQAIVFTNHETDVDQYNLGSMVRRLAFMRRIARKAVIMAKPELFDERDLIHKAQRYAIDALGAYPGVRSQDSKDEELQRLASDGTIDNSITKMLDGYHLALFPTGTRKKFSPDVGKPKSGISRIYQGVKEADPERKLILIGGGWWYGDNRDEFQPKHPELHLAEPVTIQLTDRAEILEVVHELMQSSTDIARQNFNSRQQQ